jgi:hypothetical protein
MAEVLMQFSNLIRSYFIDQLTDLNDTSLTCKIDDSSAVSQADWLNSLI